MGDDQASGWHRPIDSTSEYTASIVESSIASEDSHSQGTVNHEFHNADYRQYAAPAFAPHTRFADPHYFHVPQMFPVHADLDRTQPVPVSPSNTSSNASTTQRASLLRTKMEAAEAEFKARELALKLAKQRLETNAKHSDDGKVKMEKRGSRRPQRLYNASYARDVPGSNRSESNRGREVLISSVAEGHASRTSSVAQPEPSAALAVLAGVAVQKLADSPLGGFIADIMGSRGAQSARREPERAEVIDPQAQTTTSSSSSNEATDNSDSDTTTDSSSASSDSSDSDETETSGDSD